LIDAPVFEGAMRRKALVTAFALCLVPIAAAWAAEPAPSAGDPAAGKMLAANCASCHGLQGISVKPGVPHVAGQSATYVHAVLSAFQKGKRQGADMHKAVVGLGETDLADVAAYYASLSGFNARPPEAGATAAPDADQDPFAAVKKLTAMCAGCHGDDGNAKVAVNPSLAGQHDTYLIAAMQAYQAAARTEPMMQALVKPLERSQIEDIAYFYATMVPGAAAAPGKGDPLAGMAIAAPCATCHGADGNSTDPKNPRLAGLSADYLIAAITGYKDGSRKHDVMRDRVVALRDQDVRDLAAYYASREPQALPIRKPLMLAEWTARCGRCHGAKGNSTDPRFPLLAGQDKGYLAHALEQYHLGTRDDQLMGAMSFLLSKSDIDKLSAYYAAQRKGD
jgi:cytochrome c553